jgi:hypothetical protein
MRRSRTTSLSLGLFAIVVNILLVVGVVYLATGGVDGTGASTSPTTHTSTGDPGSSEGLVSGVTPDISGLAPSREPLTIAVLGDGTGDEDGEWVSVLSELLGHERSVRLHGLDPSDPTRYDETLTFGEVGPATSIWNGSRRSAPADYAAARLHLLVPATPNVVLLNYGRDSTARDVGEQLTATLEAIRGRWPTIPVAAILQPPDRDDSSATVRVATRRWAEAHHLATIDVAKAFMEAGDPNDFVSVVDPPSVNAAGGRLWGATVFRALGGSLDSAGQSPEPTIQP